MLIAIDIRSLIEGRHSGVEEYTTRIIKGLAKNAPWHKYVFFYNSARKSHPVFLNGIGDVVSYRFPNKLFILCQYLFSWPRWDDLMSRKIGQKPDLFFVPNAGLLPKTDRPTVVTAHDLSYKIFPELYSFKHRLWHKLMKPKQLMQNATRVISVSESTKQDLIRLYQIDRDKISVIYSGINENKKNKPTGKNKTEQLDKYNLPPRYILYLGTMEPRKNISSIVRAYTAIAKYIPHDLVIAGEKGWLQRQINQSILNSSEKNRIHCPGFVQEEDKELLYQRASLFLYPSIYEGFGFPPLEALLAGTPVITSNNSSLPEIVGNWALIVNPYDVSELAVTMKEVLTKEWSLNPNIKNEILNKYSWTRTSQKTLRTFQKATKH